MVNNRCILSRSVVISRSCCKRIFAYRLREESKSFSYPLHCLLRYLTIVAIKRLQQVCIKQRKTYRVTVSTLASSARLLPALSNPVIFTAAACRVPLPKFVKCSREDGKVLYLSCWDSRSFGSTVGSHWAFIGCCSSFDIIARTEYSLKLFLSISIFKMYLKTSMMQNFGSVNLAHWPSWRPSFTMFLFEWKWILIGLRGFIDRFWPNKISPNRDMACKLGWWLFLSPQKHKNLF